ncbi:uncharacterized protein BJX67DRAFT_342244 [Aspergillus lucknowensis]|uniref:Uncharacterized protein n=1 Tax=Aspergillus lucknowensis TaxID=176173 RepID=A0ABR4M4B5_9EURO
MQRSISLPEKIRGTLPAPNAPADQVRAYITQLLITKHHVAPDAAEKYAGKWEIGAFSQLASAPQNTIQRIFGDNAGWCIYNGMREDLFKAQDRKTSVILSAWAVRISAPALASVLFLLFSPELGLQSAQDRITWAAHPSWWLCFGISGLLYFFYHPHRDVEGLTSLLFGFFSVVVGIILVVHQAVHAA